MEHPIFKKIENANKIEFGSILSKSIDLFKRTWEQGAYHVLITIGLMLPLMIVIYLPLIPLFVGGGFYSEYGSFDPFVEYSIMVIVSYIIVILILSFIAQAVSLGIIAHFFRVLRQADTGKPMDTGGYFVYLKGTSLKKAIVLSLASFGITILAALACYLPVFYVMVPLQLTAVFYAFHEDLSVSEIIKASFKLGNKYWLTVFGLIIVSSLLAQLGILLCLVGIIITAYFVYIPIYFVYKDALGFDDADPAIL